MAEYFIHPTVFARWWLYHLDGSVDAGVLLHRLERNESTAVALDSVLEDVLTVIAADVANPTDPVVPEILSDLLSDVRRTFEELSRGGNLRLVSREPYLTTAFMTSAATGVSLADATLGAASVVEGLPLVFCTAADLQAVAFLRDRGSSLRRSCLVTFSEAMI